MLWFSYEKYAARKRKRVLNSKKGLKYTISSLEYRLKIKDLTIKQLEEDQSRWGGMSLVHHNALLVIQKTLNEMDDNHFIDFRSAKGIIIKIVRTALNKAYPDEKEIVAENIRLRKKLATTDS